MAIYGAILGVLWLVFILIWIVSAFKAKRTLKRGWYGVWWRVGFIVIVTLLIRSHLIQGSTFLSGAVLNPELNMLGVVLTALGISLAVWARFYLGGNWGMPMSIKENPELVTTGPYTLLRNPIYSGILLAILGSACIDWWWLGPFVISAAYFIVAARGEEKIMQKEFPNTYPAYKARTWALIPYVW